MLTSAQIKRKLKELTKEEVIDLLLETVKANKEAKAIVSVKLQTEPGQNPKVVSYAAMSKWLSIPEGTRRLFMGNVWCTRCRDVTTIEDFTVKMDKFGIVLEGHCAKCKHQVVRVIED